ncbi:MAG TPA: hypothetical protein VLE51_03090 [Candidatus Saccharimonadales bacterium]|nr:hypothetical protein [Candidatus Saccharimonadales bacterium]
MPRKIFVTIASGGHDTERHYQDTISHQRNVEEIANYLDEETVTELQSYTHGRPYAVWGAVSGPGNDRTWQTMERGDYVIVYRNKLIIGAAEVAYKIRNPKLAEFFWGKDFEGKTWELVYFLTNFVEVNVEQKRLNELLDYRTDFTFRGFMAIDQAKTDALLSSYGDLVSVLKKLETGQKVEAISVDKLFQKQIIDTELKKEVVRAETPHDEMQWRLISLGNKAKLDVWVPPNDQGKQYKGHVFKPHVIDTFAEALDIPSYIKNIDTVWKLGLSVKAAFEVENSTSIYSGILRLSDLRALAPNSSYPLYIVADREKRSRVFEQLSRPTFSNEYLQLNKAVKYLSYDSIRQLDEDTSAENYYEISRIDGLAESAI